MSMVMVMVMRMFSVDFHVVEDDVYESFVEC